jgi:hypothetical protein
MILHPPLVLFSIATVILGYCLMMKLRNKNYSNTAMMLGVAFQVLGGIASSLKW